MSTVYDMGYVMQLVFLKYLAIGESFKESIAFLSEKMYER